MTRQPGHQDREWTEEQRRMLGRIAAGWSYTMIAEEECVQPKTIGKRLDTIRNKLGASNDPHMIYQAIVRGVLTLPVLVR